MATLVSNQEREAIWSKLPTLRVGGKCLTKASRQDKCKLHKSQVTEWPNFAQAPEIYPIANEAGLTGRWVNNVAVVVNTITGQLGLPEFSDYQLGKDEPKDCSIGAYPDIILLERGSKTVMVGEFKTPWTTRLCNPNAEDFEKLWDLSQFTPNETTGQITSYMDRCHCRYGILSTYNETICIRRKDDYLFEASRVINHSHYSLPTRTGHSTIISTREAMLYMAYVSGNGERDSNYPARVGNLYVCMLL
ncbi:hypothetical protein ASPZODRAFT_147056 [Penicilliopsis zonata CBS 506.65]|uniref:Uncharacterized protein n=1 Tax=Penicilliopsis zonata CBS 506.65 TaxID=1073090 RepID=A0A1L9S647_9EURO|nr:hypothetical protein ASPZODRAFT_147056 [Penicilliopsis zonata CBS 506.65]OJJ42644.1 hypothetical protein ASPZODRAFT_147056 [Penicilliopsis zonata CBS 506.65]